MSSANNIPGPGLIRTEKGGRLAVILGIDGGAREGFFGILGTVNRRYGDFAPDDSYPCRQAGSVPKRARARGQTCEIAARVGAVRDPAEDNLQVDL
jgi:hypothetical protein